MSIIVQACTLAGKIIEGARWEVEFPAGVQAGHMIGINIPFDDNALTRYLTRSSSSTCLLDKNSSGYSVALSFVVHQVRHMVETPASDTNEVAKANSMATITPVNHLVENVVHYLLAPSKCDPKFIHGIRGEIRNSSGQ